MLVCAAVSSNERTRGDRPQLKPVDVATTVGVGRFATYRKRHRAQSTAWASNVKLMRAANKCMGESRGRGVDCPEGVRRAMDEARTSNGTFIGFCWSSSGSSVRAPAVERRRARAALSVRRQLSQYRSL
uniref:Uncharacterized protein n=1 Tax=Plectus sambesii TaxID=2011161 RepID=A0A914XQL9_9BILA